MGAFAGRPIRRKGQFGECGGRCVLPAADRGFSESRLIDLTDSIAGGRRVAHSVRSIRRKADGAAADAPPAAPGRGAEIAPAVYISTIQRLAADGPPLTGRSMRFTYSEPRLAIYRVRDLAYSKAGGRWAAPTRWPVRRKARFGYATADAFCLAKTRKCPNRRHR